MNPQYKKGVLELCVLSLLRQQDRYGYEISEFLSKHIDIADGTVYPLLRKLKADGYFEEEIAARLESPACRPAVCTENQPPSAHCGTAGAGAVCRLLRAGLYRVQSVGGVAGVLARLGLVRRRFDCRGGVMYGLNAAADAVAHRAAGLLCGGDRLCAADDPRLFPEKPKAIPPFFRCGGDRGGDGVRMWSMGRLRPPLYFFVK